MHLPLVSKPSGSLAVIIDITAQAPTFVADMQGSYRVQLVVNDGSESSDPVEIAIQTANAITDLAIFTEHTGPGGGQQHVKLSATSD